MLEFTLRGIRNQTWLFSMLCVLAVFTAAGCTGGGDAPELVQVTGKVTVDGEPASTGEIAFLPDSSKGNEGPQSSGRIENGTYTLFAPGGREGAVPGWHRVEIRCPEMGSTPSGESRAGGCNIPQKYENAESSGLTAEVKPGEKNEIPFKLNAS